MTAAAVFWVALGSAMGGAGRFWLVWAVDRHLEGPMPWGTLLVNLIGSTLIGVLAVATVGGTRWELGEIGRQALIVGLLGGFTTFSAFSLQTLNLIQSGEFSLALGYVALSVLLCLVGVWLGFGVGTMALR